LRKCKPAHRQILRYSRIRPSPTAHTSGAKEFVILSEAKDLGEPREALRTLRRRAARSARFLFQSDPLSELRPA
jgi:hypothetical protein